MGEELRRLEKAEPVLRTMKGWKTSTVGIVEDSALPQAARDYIDFIEQEIGAPCAMISTGSRREETLVHEDGALDGLTSGRLAQVLAQR